MLKHKTYFEVKKNWKTYILVEAKLKPKNIFADSSRFQKGFQALFILKLEKKVRHSLWIRILLIIFKMYLYSETYLLYWYKKIEFYKIFPRRLSSFVGQIMKKESQTNWLLLIILNISVFTIKGDCQQLNCFILAQGFNEQWLSEASISRGSISFNVFIRNSTANELEVIAWIPE